MTWVSAAVLAVGIPSALLAHVASRNIVESDERRLLEHEAILTSFAFESMLNQVQSALDSLGTAATVTGGDPAAFERLAGTPTLGFFAALALLEPHGDTWAPTATSGETTADLSGGIPPALGAEVERTGVDAMNLVGFRGSGLTRVLVVLSRAATDAHVVYAEVPLPEGVPLVESNGGVSLEHLDYALYLGSETPDRLVFASTTELPIGGRRAVVPVVGGAQVAPTVDIGSAPGQAPDTPGELLLVTAAKGSLTGNLAQQFPWFLLAALLGAVVAGAALVEVVLRRRDQALRLVSDLERKNDALDTALAERQAVEAALRLSEERFRSLVAASPDVLLAVNSGTGERTLLNRSDFFGHPASVVQGSGAIVALVHPDDADAVARMSEGLSTARGSGLVEDEYRIRTAEGTWEWVRARARVLDRHPGGEPKRLLAVFTPITAEREAHAHREQLEEQLRQAQRLEAVGQLAGGIAHDFNNLLAVILSYAEFAGDQLADHPAAPDVDEIKRAARRAADLTGQLLTFSRRQVVEPVVLDVNGALEQTRRILERTLEERVELRIELSTPLPPIEADPGGIEQVIMNLVVNARDALDDGGGSVTIATDTVTLDLAESDVPPGTYVRLTVSDTGCGMPPEVLDRALEPFFTTKEPGQGTGMGLATVYGIARRWGGRVTIYSEPGHGTTVRVYLPACDVDEGTTPVPSDGPVRGGRGETVFLVEDEEAVRRAARRILETNGYRVVEAASGAEAVEYADLGSVDVLLTDVIMPGGVSGRALADDLRRRHPGLAVVYMSGYTADVIAHQGVLDPEVILVEKPFSSRALLQAVADGLSASLVRGVV